MLSEQNVQNKMKNDPVVTAVLADKFLLPIETFTVINTSGCTLNDNDSCELASCGSSSFYQENLPQEETWKVYPYVPLGSLEDLLIDYFRNAAKTTMILGGEDSKSLEKEQLFNLCVTLGAEMCSLALNLKVHFPSDTFAHDFSRIVTSSSVYLTYSVTQGFQSIFKLSDSFNTTASEFIKPSCTDIGETILSVVNKLISRLGSGFKTI